METVEGYHRFRKACTDNLVHAVRVVQRHLFHLLTDSFRHLLQDVRDLFRLRPLYDGHEASPASMSLLVGQNGIDLTSRETRHIDAQVSPHIPRDHHPVPCMICVLPDLEAADGFPV